MSGNHQRPTVSVSTSVTTSTSGPVFTSQIAAESLESGVLGIPLGVQHKTLCSLSLRHQHLPATEPFAEARGCGIRETRNGFLFNFKVQSNGRTAWSSYNMSTMSKLQQSSMNHLNHVVSVSKAVAETEQQISDLQLPE